VWAIEAVAGPSEADWQPPTRPHDWPGAEYSGQCKTCNSLFEGTKIDIKRAICRVCAEKAPTAPGDGTPDTSEVADSINWDLGDYSGYAVMLRHARSLELSRNAESRRAHAAEFDLAIVAKKIGIERGYSEKVTKERNAERAEKLKLQAEVEALRADKLRLDWLDSKREDEVQWSGDPASYPELVAHYWAIYGQCSDVRTAIDAALSSLTPAKP